MNNAQDVFKECSLWMRLSICVHIHIKEALMNVMHNKINDPQVTAIPSDPTDLYVFLQNNKGRIQRSRFIKEHQKSILLPASSQIVDSTTFDISLTRFIIQTFCVIRNARGDWKEPDPRDKTLCAYVFRAAEMRNSIAHYNNIKDLSLTEFETKWKELKEILQGLKYVKDIESFKTEKLDVEKHEQVILKEFVDLLRSYKEECSNEKFQDDYILRRFHVDKKRNNIFTKPNVACMSKDYDENNSFEWNAEAISEHYVSNVESISEGHENTTPRKFYSESAVEATSELNDEVFPSSESNIESISEGHENTTLQKYYSESDLDGKKRHYPKSEVESTRENDKKNEVTESGLENLVKDNDRLVIYGEAGMGKTSTARRLRNEWCNNKILNGHHLIYYDSKRMNKLLTIKSFAAPLYFSEQGDYLRKIGRTEDDLSIYKCVITNIDELFIIIDGIDEFPLRELVTSIDELERKVNNNERINATETISAIYFGFLFPYSKILLLGRIGEFEVLNEVQVESGSGIFNRRTKDLELLKFNDVDIKDFICLNICKQSTQRLSCTSECQVIYKEIENIELCKIPTNLNSLIKLFKKHPSKNIGKITRTKLIITTLFNRLTNHIKQKNKFTFKDFREINEQKELSKYLECIRAMGEISFYTLLEDNVTVKVEEKQGHFKYKEHISVERKVFEELDFFYVCNSDDSFTLEPHHLTNMEFLSACYLFSNPDKWNSILKLKKNRQLVIIPFIVGLHADDHFTRDFVENVLNNTDNSLEKCFNWLYNVAEGNRYSLPNGGNGYDCWYGLMENQELSPPFFLLDSISYEVEIPQTFIPKTIVCYDSSFEWYSMKYFKHNCITKLSDKLNIELFLTKFPTYNFLIKGDIKITKNDQIKLLNNFVINNHITFKINVLAIYTSLDTFFSFNFNLNALDIRGWHTVNCDSRTIDTILNAISLPTKETSSLSIPTIKCKRLYIEDIYIKKLNYQQTKKLFTLFTLNVVDYIALRSTFFTDEQIEILKNVERDTNKMVNIELYNVKFDCVFDLPNLGNRHVSLNDIGDVTDNDLIRLKYMPSGYSDNFFKYKILHFNVPFVRRENYTHSCEQSLYLNMCNVDFRDVSPDVFAHTFSSIPSFACRDNNDYIPSPHWLSLSHTKRCRINEMRIWNPRSKNFEHFLNIGANVIQFICASKDNLKQLLNHIANNPNVQLNKRIKVFLVEYDYHDWNYYEESSLFGPKTIEEYKNNYSSNDIILVPIHDGGFHFKRWCCEIMLPIRKSMKNIKKLSKPRTLFSLTTV